MSYVINRKFVLVPILTVFCLFTLLIQPPQKAQANPAAAGIVVAGGLSVSAFVYSGLVLAAAYGISQIDENTGQAVKEHAINSYNALDSAAKTTWDATIDAIDWTTDAALSLSSEAITSLSGALSFLNPSVPIKSAPIPAWGDLENIVNGSSYTWRSGSPNDYVNWADVGDGYTARVLLEYDSYNQWIKWLLVDIYNPTLGTHYREVLLKQTSSGYYNTEWDPAFATWGYYSTNGGNGPIADINKFFSVWSPTAILDYAISVYVEENLAPPPLSLPADVTMRIPPFPTDTSAEDAYKIPPIILNPDVSQVYVGDTPVWDVANPTTVPDLTTGTGTTTGEYTGFFDTIIGLLQSIADFFKQGLLGDLNINWSKLNKIYSGFTTAFPFSLPWDVGRAFDAVFGNFNTTDAPEWQFSLYGQSWTIRIPDMLLSWFPITRLMLLIMFDIGLVYSVRKLLGGAS